MAINKKARICLKYLVCLTMVFVVMLLICGCHRSPYCPVIQRGTKWQSEDGRIYFEVPETGAVESAVIGKIYFKQENIEIEIGSDFGDHLLIFDITYRKGGRRSLEDRCEYLNCRFVSEDMFIAKAEEATYLTAGEILVFHKIKG